MKVTERKGTFLEDRRRRKWISYRDNYRRKEDIQFLYVLPRHDGDHCDMMVERTYPFGVRLHRRYVAVGHDLLSISCYNKKKKNYTSL